MLDGELVLWHKEHKAYVPFGYLKSFINAANRGSAAAALETARYRAGGVHGEEGEEEDGAGDDEEDEDRARISNHQFAYGEKPLLVRDLELVYVAFDVLYDTDHSVIDEPLRERHAILRRLFRPVPTLPGADDDDDSDGERSGHVASDGSVPLGPEGSGAATSVVTRGRVEVNVPALDGEEEPGLRRGFVARRHRTGAERTDRQEEEEGLVIKDLAAKWTPGERGPGGSRSSPTISPRRTWTSSSSAAFTAPGCDGAARSRSTCWGSWRPPRCPTPNHHVVSFSKVGIGMSEDVLDKLRRRLNSHMIEAKRGFALQGATRSPGGPRNTRTCGSATRVTRW